MLGLVGLMKLLTLGVGESNRVIDARRDFSGVCRSPCPVVLELHRFFTAFSRAVVNSDESVGTDPDRLVWSAGALLNRRRVVHAVRNYALLCGRALTSESDWIGVLPLCGLCGGCVLLALLCSCAGYMGSCLGYLFIGWLVGLILGVGGVSYVEMLLLYELWAVEWLVLEKAVPVLGDLDVQFLCRLFFLAQALIFGVVVVLLDAEREDSVDFQQVLADFSLVVVGPITGG